MENHFQLFDSNIDASEVKLIKHELESHGYSEKYLGARGGGIMFLEKIINFIFHSNKFIEIGITGIIGNAFYEVLKAIVKKLVTRESKTIRILGLMNIFWWFFLPKK